MIFVQPNFCRNRDETYKAHSIKLLPWFRCKIPTPLWYAYNFAHTLNIFLLLQERKTGSWRKRWNKRKAKHSRCIWWRRWCKLGCKPEKEEAKIQPSWCSNWRRPTAPNYSRAPWFRCLCRCKWNGCQYEEADWGEKKTTELVYINFLISKSGQMSQWHLKRSTNWATGKPFNQSTFAISITQIAPSLINSRDKSILVL